jgi:hypothetical protein
LLAVRAVNKKVKNKNMQTKDFLKKRKFYQDELKKFQKQVDIAYTKIVKEFISENSPVKNLKVYELLENGIKRKGFKRFIIYTQEVNVFDKMPMIRVGGWWLDVNNIPAKWDNMTVFGVGNPAKFVLSENQEHEKHPDSIEK